MSRFKIQVKNSIIKQPIKRYIPPNTIGIEFFIDFAKCDPKNSLTIEYLKTIVPSENNIVAVNAVTTWIIKHKELNLKLYSPKQHILEYIQNNKTPVGIQKKEIIRVKNSGSV